MRRSDDYRLLQKRLGLTRNVGVTPSTYGTDNSVTLDAIAKLGADTEASRWSMRASATPS